MIVDIYEHFDFDVEDIGDNNAIYNPTFKTWSYATPSLWDSLRLFKSTQIAIAMFHKNDLDPEDIASVVTYQKILDMYAQMKKALQPFANEFCVRHKGYSLN